MATDDVVMVQGLEVKCAVQRLVGLFCLRLFWIPKNNNNKY